MRKVAGKICACVAAVVYTSATVSAATVSGPSGAVLVNEGNGFQPLKGATELAPGASVMVRPGAVATITYSNTCAVKVGSERVWTIQAQAPCASGGTEIDLSTRMNQAGPGEGMGAGTLALGALAVGGGVALIGCLVSWCKSSSNSASP